MSAKARYVQLLRGLVRAALENRESLDALKLALEQVAKEVGDIQNKG